jgi:hypothetical protein
MASKPEDGGGGNAPQGVNPATDAQHIASPDFDGEKVVVVQPPQTDDNAQNLPQPTATLVNTDPRSLPQVVGIEDDGNSPPQTWAVDADPKSFPQAVGTKHDGDNDKGMTVAGAPATEPAVTAGTARTMAINGEDGDEESGSRDSKRQLKRKRMLFIIAGVVFLVTALAVGLGVGLTSRKSSSQ